MSFGEARRLTHLLSRDPSSALCAAVQGWDAAVTPEWLLLADLYDLTHRVAAAKPQHVKPYPRPFPDPNKRRRGRTTRTRAEVISILRDHGHSIGGSA